MQPRLVLPRERSGPDPVLPEPEPGHPEALGAEPVEPDHPAALGAEPVRPATLPADQARPVLVLPAQEHGASAKAPDVSCRDK